MVRHEGVACPDIVAAPVGTTGTLVTTEGAVLHAGEVVGP
jgi:hypothetical protein